jgi:hypothetical protein
MKLSNEELMKIITENAQRLCIFYTTKEGMHLESLNLTNPICMNGDDIQLNCETTNDV